jgi:hypothetical protein
MLAGHFLPASVLSEFASRDDFRSTAKLGGVLNNGSAHLFLFGYVIVSERRAKMYTSLWKEQLLLFGDGPECAKAFFANLAHC